MIWEFPAAFKILDAIEPHIDRLISLTLVITDYLGENNASRLSGLSHLIAFNSLRRIFIPFSEESNISIYHQFLSGLQLDKLTIEIGMPLYGAHQYYGSYSRIEDFSWWFTGTSIWEHITTLIVHGRAFCQSSIMTTDVPYLEAGLRRSMHGMTKPVMHKVKFLTIRGTSKVLEEVTFPSVTYLELSSSSLSSQNLPRQVEVLKIIDTEISFYGSFDLAKVPYGVRIFTGVTSKIGWFTNGTFSVPGANSIHIEDLDILDNEGKIQPLDISSFLNSHESIKSIDRVYLSGMAITPAAIKALQMARSLSQLTIEGCYFEGDAFSHLHHMLLSHNQEFNFPHLKFLRISGFYPSSEPTEEKLYDKIDTERLIADAASTQAHLHIEAGGFKYWQPPIVWDSYQQNGIFGTMEKSDLALFYPYVTSSSA
jgi:hypothetical protein